MSVSLKETLPLRLSVSVDLYLYKKEAIYICQPHESMTS